MTHDHVSLVTLGVADLARSCRFYADFGFRRFAFPSDDVAFFQLRNITLGLYGRAALAADASVDDDGHGFRGVSLAINVPTEDDVQPLLDMAASCGGRIVKPAERAEWGGFSGYFADPDTHLWEVAHNPFFPLEANGRFALDIEA